MHTLSALRTLGTKGTDVRGWTVRISASSYTKRMGGLLTELFRILKAGDMNHEPDNAITGR